MTAALGIYLGVACVRIHPYYLDYYNEVVGGPSGAWEARLFETGWWGEGMDRAVAWVNDNAPEKATSVVFRGTVDHTLADIQGISVRNNENPELG